MIIPARQKGISLFLALIALVVLSLGAISLFQSVDTGSLVAGNIAFRQSATAVSDQAIEDAVAWLEENNTGSVLYNDNTAQGYYAANLDMLDPVGKQSTMSTRTLIDWDANGCVDAGDFSACLESSAPSMIGDYTIRYIIIRMCSIEGDPNSVDNNCTKVISSSGGQGSKKGGLSYGENERFASASGRPYYRILARVAGPKDTVTYTETYVYF